MHSVEREVLEQWSFHFTNMAAVNDWDDATKLKLLKVRLTGKAQTAFQRLLGDTQESYNEASISLKERFGPPSHQSRYQAELGTRRRKLGESWGNLANNLRELVDEAYKDLEDKQERVLP